MKILISNQPLKEHDQKRIITLYRVDALCRLLLEWDFVLDDPEVGMLTADITNSQGTTTVGTALRFSY